MTLLKVAHGLGLAWKSGRRWATATKRTLPVQITARCLRGDHPAITSDGQSLTYNRYFLDKTEQGEVLE